MTRRETHDLSESQSSGGLADELRKDVESLASRIGERNTKHYDALLEAERFIEAAFREADLPVSRQGYLADGRLCHNLIADIGPGPNKEIIVIGAPYDSIRGGPGANDNASGIAALLHLARTVGRHSFGRTVRLVAFVNEERPYLRTSLMGSAVYASLCRQQQLSIAAMLSLETIGYYPALDPPDHDPWTARRLLRPFQGNFVAVVGNLTSRRLVRRVSGVLRQARGIPVKGICLPALLPGVKSSDHWSFWKQGYPACMVTDTAPLRYPFYHTANDTADKLSYRTLGRVVRGLERVVICLASPRREWAEALPGPRQRCGR